MHLLLLITGLVLFPNAYGLRCHQCKAEASHPGVPVSPEPCTEMRCPASKQCAATSMKALHIMGTYAIQRKTCMAADQCISGSANIGLGRFLVSSKCCSTDLCNDQYPTPPTSAPLNGKKCYSCTDPDFCFNIVPCSGDEDCCVSAIFNNQTAKGCASKSVCDADLSHLFPPHPGSEGIEVRCCEGDLCNGATRTAVSNGATRTATSNGATRTAEGDLCNGAMRTAVSILFLMLAPVVSVLFS